MISANFRSEGLGDRSREGRGRVRTGSIRTYCMHEEPMNPRSPRWNLRSALVSVRAAGLAAGLAALLPGCGVTRPFYSGYRFDSPILVETDRSEMVQYLDWVIKSERLQRITLVTPDKGVQSLVPRDASSPETTDWLPLPVLFAARYILNPRLKGLEIDLLARTEAEGFTPVSATHDLDGSVRIEMGTPFKELLPQSEPLPTRDELSKRYAIGAILDGERAWQPLEIHSLSQALGLLTEAELVAIRGIPFMRHARAKSGAKGYSADKIWGEYHGDVGKDASVEAREIHLFDTSPGHDTSLFIGEPGRFYPIPVMCLLHEIGHAIADYARIRIARTHSRLIDVHNQRADEWNGLRAAGRLTSERAVELQKQLDAIKAESAKHEPLYQAIKQQYKREDGPVHAAYLLARGNEKGPTPYGRTDIEESFAESFALYKADPSALKRVYPGLYEWFAAGRHIQALRDAMGAEFEVPATAVQTAVVAPPG